MNPQLLRVAITTIAALLVTSFAVPTLATPITIETVPVGNAGNVPDSTGYGAVDYEYRIGKYEVTNAQYSSFLNAVAVSDSVSLYNANMGSSVHGGITRSGAAGSYSYAVKPSMGNKPVNFVNYYSAVRFANWLHHGQPTGSDTWITETGAYTLLGGTATPSNGLTLTRNAGAQWFLPSENEWYKAAYYNAAANSYYLYPTSSDAAPLSTAPPGDSNSANYFGSGVGTSTEVGAYFNTSSPYGTFDQAGNTWEWNEALISGSNRGMRGGSWNDASAIGPLASYRPSFAANSFSVSVGFRVATVPEPSSYLLAALGLAWVVGVGSLRKCRRDH